MNTLQLREGRAGDAAAISALIVELAPAFFLSPDGAGTEPFLVSVSAAAEAGYIADTRYRFWVLEATDGALAGFIASRDTSHLFHLFVSPAWQGQGLSRRLWQAMQDGAAEAGHGGAFTVNAALPAVGVYEHFGFVAEGPVQRQHGLAFQPMRLAGPAGEAGCDDAGLST